MKNLWIFEKNKLLILQALLRCDNYLCGSDFTDHLDIPKNLVSYHIRALREKGFILEQQVGRNKNYQLNPEKVEETLTILKAVGLLLPERERNNYVS